MSCKICEARRPRRFCPGVGGDICTVCCGTEREMTVHCPLDCVYLQEARRHEKLPELDPKQLPNRDIEISESFLHEHWPLLMFLAQTVLESAFTTSGVTDLDLREALDALVRTYRTRQTGLYYDSRPSNLLAGAVYDRVQRAVEEFERSQRERSGVSSLREAEVLGVLVFLQRLEYMNNNGRRLSRAFLDSLRGHFGEPGTAGPPPAESRLIVP